MAKKKTITKDNINPEEVEEGELEEEVEEGELEEEVEEGDIEEAEAEEKPKRRKKKKIMGLTDKEIEKQRKLIPFDLAKQLTGNIMTFIENDKRFELISQPKLNNRKIALTFQIVDEAIDKELMKLDKKQKKLDEFKTNKENPPEEEEDEEFQQIPFDDNEDEEDLNPEDIDIEELEDE